MKLIAVDNFNREAVADILIADRLTDYWANMLEEALNNSDQAVGSGHYFRAVPDDHRLWRGMEDLV